MSLTNYRDLSTPAGDASAGFQFEFFCERCGETSRSAFRPYRKGQLTGWLNRLGGIFHELHQASRATEVLAESGEDKAKGAALDEARAAAAPLYERCSLCRKWAGRECWDAASGSCRACATQAAAAAGNPHTAAPGRVACPHCQAPSHGGRFCHECGFDMASTHKSCPACGTTLAREARFCTDCGHGF